MTRELPHGWVVTTLGDVCEVTLGQSPPGSSYNDTGLGSPFLQGKAEFGDRYPTFRKWTTKPKKHALAGSVLISVRAPVGPTNVTPIDCAIGRGLSALRPLADISTEYILWAMRRSVDSLIEQATGSTFKAITGNKLRSHCIPIAPLAEQKRIVAAIEEYFSRLDAIEFALRRVTEKIEACRSSILTEAFSGRLVPQNPDDEPTPVLLKRISALRADSRRGHNNCGYQTASNTSNTIDQLPSGWIQTTVGYLCKVEYGKGLRKSDRIETGSIPVYGSAGPVGYHDSALVDEPVVIVGRKGNAGAVWHTARPSWPIDTTYFLKVPQGCSSTYLGLLIGHLGLRAHDTSTTIPSLRRPDLEAVVIKLAPTAEQKRIVAAIEEHFSRLDVVEKVVSKALNKLKTLRRSILAEAFSGRLAPQDTNDEPASVLLERIAASRPAKPKRRKNKI